GTKRHDQCLPEGRRARPHATPRPAVKRETSPPARALRRTCPKPRDSPPDLLQPAMTRAQLMPVLTLVRLWDGGLIRVAGAQARANTWAFQGGPVGWEARMVTKTTVRSPGRELRPTPPRGTTMVAGWESTYLPTVDLDGVEV